MSPRNSFRLNARLAVSIALGIAFLWTGASPALAGEPPAPPEEKASLGSYMPYIIGGTVLLGIVAIAVLVNVAKQAERKANPLAAALPADMQTEGNPLTRLVVPLLIGGGLAVGLFLVFKDVDNGFDAVKQAVNTPTPSLPKVHPVEPTYSTDVGKPIDPVPRIQFPAPQVVVPQPQGIR